MTWAALTSGGKDSILALQKSLDEGLAVSHMVTVVPKNSDSYMFHSANLSAVPVMAERCGMSYVGIETEGEKEEELSDLLAGLSQLPIDGVIVGAIESEYQRSRVQKICDELNIKMSAPLWKMNSIQLLREVAARMDVRVVVTAANGFSENILGKKIDEDLIAELLQLEKKYHIHIAGEGGEYETLTINAPCFTSPLNFSEMNISQTSMRGCVTIEKFW